MTKFKMGNRFYTTMARLLKDACTAFNKVDKDRFESSVFELYQMIDTLSTEAKWNEPKVQPAKKSKKNTTRSPKDRKGTD